MSRAHFDQPLHLRSGSVLPAYDLVYETYGTLNADKSNAVLICHALSGHHHAAGYHHENETKAGWWDNCIGPNKAIDTNQFFVVALNNLGGCSARVWTICYWRLPPRSVGSLLAV